MLLHQQVSRSCSFDFDAVATAAAKRESSVRDQLRAPERLDLSAALIRAARAKGCKFVISTDAHHPKHLANMSYGVKMARRGWLERRRRHQYFIRRFEFREAS